ncbi:hypothetical protein I4U23_025305 [Adineta vaga]|nr:hypothetical protein I4U23_025305 [Adineta vaga]
MYSVPPRKPRALMRERNDKDIGNAQCQKCLEKGHWTYQCTRKRKYVERPSRTQVLDKRIKQLQKDQEEGQKNANEMKKKQVMSQLKTIQFDKKKKTDDDDGNSSDSSSSGSSTSSSSGSSTSGSSGSSSSSSSSSSSNDGSGSDSDSSNEDEKCSPDSDHESPKKKAKA